MGAPCTAGNLELIWIDRMASFAFKGLMETTNFPENCPAGSQSIFVRYIGTIVSLVICCISIPDSIRGNSNDMEQPNTKVTKSSFQYFLISKGSSTKFPFSQTRYCGTSVRISISPRSFSIGSPFVPKPINGHG